jgi:hypothetical protein
MAGTMPYPIRIRNDVRNSTAKVYLILRSSVFTKGFGDEADEAAEAVEDVMLEERRTAELLLIRRCQIR